MSCSLTSVRTTKINAHSTYTGFIFSYIKAQKWLKRTFSNIKWEFEYQMGYLGVLLGNVHMFCQCFCIFGSYRMVFEIILLSKKKVLQWKSLLFGKYYSLVLYKKRKIVDRLWNPGSFHILTLYPSTKRNAHLTCIGFTLLHSSA